MSRQRELGLPEDIEILPPDWPCDQKPRDLLPGDLSQFAANQGPQRTDLAQFHPFRFDPKINPAGGLIYFDEYVDLAELKTTLRLIGVFDEMTDYAVFAASSIDPAQEDFLDQLRFVSHHALECGYLIWTREPPTRPVSLWQVTEAFIAGQRAKWNGGRSIRASLARTRGGDGEGAKEALGFGFMVEDTEWRICRLWSRSWLVTK